MIGMLITSDIAYFQYNSEQNMYNSYDYYVVNNRINKLNGRFFFNIQVDSLFYSSLTMVRLVDPVFTNQTFSISASFVGSNILVTKEILINDYDSKIFDFYN